jgi:peptide/nickel transport system ATP-binding protein
MTTLEIRGLTVRFAGRHRTLTAVDGVDLHLPSGQVLGLVGESGSGKSTVARALVGLVPISAGQVLLEGEDIAGRGRRVAAARRQIQMVFQDPYGSLNPRMTVGETIGEAVAAHGRVGRRQRHDEVERLLELVALDPDHARRLPRELSGGQRQRVAIARALAAEPRILIADEVTSALDASVQGAILNLLRDLQARLGLTVLFISHNLAVVRYVSDVVAVMYLGKVVEIATTDELLERPQHPYTRALLDAVPQLGAVPVELAAGLLDADPPDPHDPPPGCRFHTRCPVGPLLLPERTICATGDPDDGASDRLHQAACHFAGGSNLSRLAPYSAGSSRPE